MRTIRISEAVWQAIAERGKFGETPNQVLERVFGIEKPETQEARGTETVREGRAYSLAELRRRVNLGRDTRPEQLQIGHEAFRVNTWVDVCTTFVKWLIKNNHLSRSDCPVPTGSERGDKLFINREPYHRVREKDGDWKEVGDFYVDVKYSAEYHVKNLLYTLKHLGVRDVDVKISFLSN